MRTSNLTAVQLGPSRPDLRGIGCRTQVSRASTSGRILLLSVDLQTSKSLGLAAERSQLPSSVEKILLLAVDRQTSKSLGLAAERSQLPRVSRKFSCCPLTARHRNRWGWPRREASYPRVLRELRSLSWARIAPNAAIPRIERFASTYSSKSKTSPLSRFAASHELTIVASARSRVGTRV